MAAWGWGKAEGLHDVPQLSIVCDLVDKAEPTVGVCHQSGCRNLPDAIKVIGKWLIRVLWDSEASKNAWPVRMFLGSGLCWMCQACAKCQWSTTSEPLGCRHNGLDHPCTCPCIQNQGHRGMGLSMHLTLLTPGWSFCYGYRTQIIVCVALRSNHFHCQYAVCKSYIIRAGGLKWSLCMMAGAWVVSLMGVQDARLNDEIADREDGVGRALQTISFPSIKAIMTLITCFCMSMVPSALRWMLVSAVPACSRSLTILPV